MSGETYNIDNFLGLTDKTQKTNNTNFLSLKIPGVYRIRILEKFTSIYAHYIFSQRISVACLKDNCPICNNNFRIMNAHPDNYRDQPGFYPQTLRHVANVLDRTPVKVCPACGTENFDFMLRGSNLCTNCGNSLADIAFHPVDKVKLASFSDTFMEQLKIIALSILDENGNVIPLTHYDINVLVSIVNNKKTVSPSANPKEFGEINIDKEFFLDVHRSVIHFSNKELVDILRGDNWRDVLAAKTASNKEATIYSSANLDLVEPKNEEARIIEENIKSLFS